MQNNIDTFLSGITSAMKTLVDKTMKQRKLEYTLDGYEQALNDMRMKVSNSKESPNLKNIKRRRLTKKLIHVQRSKKYNKKMIKENETNETLLLKEALEKIRRKLAHSKQFKQHVNRKQEEKRSKSERR